MIHHILWFCFSIFETLQETIEDVISVFSEKIEEFIFVCLWFIFCLPVFLIKQILSFFVSLCKKERNYRKNIKVFMKWYREQRKA